MLSEFEREQLVAPCLYWIANLSESDCEGIIRETSSAIRKWRAKEKRAPKPKPVTNGLLAGAPEPDDIGAAFQLWLTDDPAFLAIIEKRGLYLTFAALLASSWRTAHQGSLIRVNDLLTRELVFQVHIAHKIGRQLFEDRQRQGDQEQALRQEQRRKMDELRELSKATKRQRKLTRHDNLRRGARELFEHRPSRSVREVAIFLKDRNIDRYGDGDAKGLSISTIEKIIGSIREQVRKEMREPYPKNPAAKV